MTKEQRRQFGNKLRQLREACGEEYTIKVMAEIIDEYSTNIARWEAGESLPNYKSLRRLHEFFKDRLNTYRAEDLFSI